MYLHTGTIQSNTITAPAGFAHPTSDEYATHVVKALGSGRVEVVPFFGHWIGLTMVRSLPDFLLRYVLKEEAKGLFNMEARKSKKEC